MSRLLLFSDVHADLNALQSALTLGEQLGCERSLCAGDLLDGGPSPNETLALLQEAQVSCVSGNHDRWALDRGAHQNAAKEHLALSREATKYVASLPASSSLMVAGTKLALHHAWPGDDMRGIYPDASLAEQQQALSLARADVLVVGHTHVAMALKTAGGGMILNPGVLSRSAKPSQRHRPSDHRCGTCMVLDLPGGVVTLYDVMSGEPIAFPSEPPVTPSC